jgi:hypothetical protein
VYARTWGALGIDGAGDLRPNTPSESLSADDREFLVRTPRCREGFAGAV